MYNNWSAESPIRLNTSSHPISSRVQWDTKGEVNNSSSRPFLWKGKRPRHYSTTVMVSIATQNQLAEVKQSKMWPSRYDQPSRFLLYLSVTSPIYSHSQKIPKPLNIHFENRNEDQKNKKTKRWETSFWRLVLGIFPPVPPFPVWTHLNRRAVIYSWTEQDRARTICEHGSRRATGLWASCDYMSNISGEYLIIFDLLWLFYCTYQFLTILLGLKDSILWLREVKWRCFEGLKGRSGRRCELGGCKIKKKWAFGLVV